MFREFFKGRYGIDRFTLVLFLLSAILINRHYYVWLLGVGLLGYAIFRMFSRNIHQRYEELKWYNKIESKIIHYFTPLLVLTTRSLRSAYKKFLAYKARWQQRKYYVFIKCPKCKKTLRLPRNKGKLSVACPVCKFEFMKKT